MVRASTLPWSKRTSFATVQRRSTMLCGTGTMQSKIGTLSRRCVLIHNMGNWILILCLLTFSSCLPFFLHSVPSPCHFFCCCHTCHLPLPLPFPAVHPPSSGAAICHLCHLPCCEGSPVTIVSALGPHLWQGPSWSSIACRHLLEIVNTHLNAWTDTHKTVLSTSRPRVFNPVQAHVAESVQFASVATIACLQSVTTQISRTAHQVCPKRVCETCHNRHPSAMLWLASPKGLQVHHSPWVAHMFRLQKGQSWSSWMPLSREGITPHFIQQKGMGRADVKSWLVGEIPPSHQRLPAGFWSWDSIYQAYLHTTQSLLHCSPPKCI